MDELYKNFKYSIDHLATLHKTFVAEGNFSDNEKLDYSIYRDNLAEFSHLALELGIDKQLYDRDGRQMILSDIIEYIFLGRGYYAIESKEEKQKFVQAIIRFVNLLMCYETMTISKNLRDKYLEKLVEKIPQIKDEEFFNELLNCNGNIGLPLPQSASKEEKKINKYFDSLLPKTAGGLWHELIVYSFLLRNKIGHVIPLLLIQRIHSGESTLIPPDFLVISHDKRMYGIEVGTKQDIHKIHIGTFSLQTAIPTATIDTINSRTSDRCPICKRWILFCDFAIKNYSNFDLKINKENFEIKCLSVNCGVSKDDKLNGNCPYTKYSRSKIQSEFGNHDFATGLHYHYQCVLNNVSPQIRKKIIEAEDNTAIKTHFPYYSGIESLLE
jgi:hypothetical protein